MPGWAGGASKQALSVHNCAYAFGTLNLLRHAGHGDLYRRVVGGRALDLNNLLDETSWLPRYPWWFTHHGWRVSHWLGGAPSLLLSAGASDLPEAEQLSEVAKRALDAANNALDPRTGLIRLYRSGLLQKAFKTAYAVRHDPTLGDLGGVAHVLWVNHVLDRPYVAAEALLKAASREFLARKPFIEKAPYCLDFDIVQIARTAADLGPGVQAPLRGRALEMMRDIEAFFGGEIPEAYTLHKVPGALATHHECGLIASTGGHSSAPYIDIIKLAYWL